jgi:hypothetical protein
VKPFLLLFVVCGEALFIAICVVKPFLLLFVVCGEALFIAFCCLW